MKRLIRRVLTTIACFMMLLATFGCGATINNDERPSGKQAFQSADIDDRFLAANRQFAFQLYDHMLKEDEGKNIFISPLSVSTALAMTYNGAAEETKEAMAEALQIQGLSLEDVNHSHAALKYVIEQADPDVELSIANSLWGREGTPFKTEFLKRNEQFYDAKVSTLDFDDPRASDTINDWVREQTNGKIEDIVDENIHPLTILFLINAIYFKGGWTEPFEEARTTDDDFHLLDGATKTVPLMSQSGEYDYYKNEHFEAIQLPYGNERFSMAIFLPTENSSLEQFHQQLNEENWQEWRADFKTETGSVHLPRFQLEYEKTLNKVLKALGMEVAFDEYRANFEQMVDIPPNAYIKNVKHKTFIEVNEEGSEAAATTSVEMRIESAPMNAFNMKVDRPFFFTIQDNETGSLLFMGSVVEPE